MVEGVRQRLDELEEMRAHTVSAVTYPPLLLIEPLQLLLLGAQLLFQLPAASLESLCVLPNQRRRQRVPHPAPIVPSLVSTHLNSPAGPQIPFHVKTLPVKPQTSVTHLLPQ